MFCSTTRQVLDATEVVNRKRPDGSAIKIAVCTAGAYTRPLLGST
jgi:hypothetical protein